MLNMKPYYLLILFFCTISFSQNSIVEEIRNEALGNNLGNPLPLASTYQSGALKFLSGGAPLYGSCFTIQEQVDLIKKGHHFLPVFANRIYDFIDSRQLMSGYYNGLSFIVDNCLPITVLASKDAYAQWEQVLFQDPDIVSKYSTSELSIQEGSNGKTWVSPMGDVKAWEEVGINWTDKTDIKNLQTKYKNPPKIIMMSNNEVRTFWRQIKNGLSIDFNTIHG